jgi:hypothetical protein
LNSVVVRNKVPTQNASSSPRPRRWFLILILPVIDGGHLSSSMSARPVQWFSGQYEDAGSTGFHILLRVAVTVLLDVTLIVAV